MYHVSAQGVDERMINVHSSSSFFSSSSSSSFSLTSRFQSHFWRKKVRFCYIMYLTFYPRFNQCL